MMAIVWLVTLLSVISGSGSFLLDKPKPHIIFIVADDLGWNDVGWHNDQVYSPNLNKLARDGVILNSSYVQPLCSPSRSSFMTGYYPYHLGLQHSTIQAQQANHLPLSYPTIAEKLKEQGYTTHMIGKWHLGFCNWKHTPTYRGFDSFLGHYTGYEDHYNHTHYNGYDFRWNETVYNNVTGQYSTEIFADHAVQIINNVDPSTQPLYMYIPFQAVHFPLQVPEKYMKHYPTDLGQDRRSLLGMVTAIDEAVGKIVDKLRQRGFLQNTLLVFTTDNGGDPLHGSSNNPLRGEKGSLWEGGTRGAAFVYSETLLKKTGYVNNGLMHAVDWYPTFLTLAGGNPDSGIDGVDQWPSLSQGLNSSRTELIYNIDEATNSSAIRVGKYKVTHNAGRQNQSGRPQNGTGVVSSMNKVTTTPMFMSEYQLFDLEDDPLENHDLSSQLPDVLEKLKTRLTQYQQTLVPELGTGPKLAEADPSYFNDVWSPGWC